MRKREIERLEREIERRASVIESQIDDVSDVNPEIQSQCVLDLVREVHSWAYLRKVVRDNRGAPR